MSDLSTETLIHQLVKITRKYELAPDDEHVVRDCVVALRSGSKAEEKLQRILGALRILRESV